MIGKALERLELGALVVASACIFLMMVLVSVDTLARYFFSSPLQFQFEFTSMYLMVAGCTLGIAWGARRGALIRLKGLGQLLPPRGRSVLHGVNHLLGAVLFGLMTYYAGERAYASYLDGDVEFGVIDWPLWLSEVWVPIACALLSARLLYDGGRLFRHGPDSDDNQGVDP